LVDFCSGKNPIKHSINYAQSFETLCIEANFLPFYDTLVLDPRLEPLRRDERFKPILEKFREDFVDIMRVLDQVRSRGELPSYFEAPFADLLKKLQIKL